MLNKAVQAAIYEKVLKKHYMEVLYIDFEDTGKCKKLHQDTKLVNGENIFPESDDGGKRSTSDFDIFGNGQTLLLSKKSSRSGI